MKHIIFIFSAILLLIGGCIKDESTLAINEIPIIGIDTAGFATRHTVFQQDTLVIEPVITIEHGDRNRLKYKWTMNTFGYERLVGTASRLEAVINEAPSPTAYKLIFTATDSLNNIKTFFTWDISVISPFGQGLVVADTRDEKTTDLNLIMAFNFTTAIQKDSLTERIIYNAYSVANGEKIEGLVSHLDFYRYNAEKNVTLLTDKALTRIDVNSYKKVDTDEKLFLIPPTKIVPTDISTAIVTNQHQYLVNNGKAHGRYGQSRQFLYSFLASDKLGYETKKIIGLQNPSLSIPGGVLYDELNSRFLILPGIVYMADPLRNFPTFDPKHSSAKFDPGQMGNKTCLHMFEGYDKSMMCIMKERDQEKYYAYQIRFTAPLSGGMGVAVNDLSQNPDISNARFFTSSTSEQVLFYGTPDKVYTTIVEIGSPSTTTLRYQTNPGEKITGMKIFTGSGRMYLPSSSDPLDWTKRISTNASQRLLLLSIYNENTKEGKIITIPIESLGVGGLVTNPDYIREYRGFGRITSFGLQN
ncbi:PKD-like family lipoprotein [Sphingobacterium faecale]|uniref:PKD family protein n=1 Tax=Sphingobacterium faecale TaxID=2803775 RepID=A0ABS1QYP0_9SPHI|nr:PKD-like family lipoprotein [Sphingobacterium faecale]MBL1407551.1 hypothetical protein [Sphingobacterium faecale]